MSLIVCYMVFFFQAEDGIRYWSVTGVQTCALPISGAARHPGRRLRSRGCLAAPGRVPRPLGAARLWQLGHRGEGDRALDWLRRAVETRSGERRVGEEGGGRGGEGYGEKKVHEGERR